MFADEDPVSMNRSPEDPASLSYAVVDDPRSRVIEVAEGEYRANDRIYCGRGGSKLFSPLLLIATVDDSAPNHSDHEYTSSKQT